MPKLIVLVGPPGAGKTTLAHDFVQEGFTRISQDDMGKEYLGHFDDAIMDGKDVVIDRLNFTKQQRSRFVDVAKARGYETAIAVIHEPSSICFQRCMARKDHPTIKDEKDALSALSMFFSKYERVTGDEADAVIRLWPEGEKPLACLVDLDGTMFDCSHRRHFVEGPNKNWKRFFDGIPDDPINEWCADIAWGLRSSHTIVFCTGRGEDLRSVTEAQLKKYRLDQINNETMLSFDDRDRNFFLFMRPSNDSRQDGIIKEVILDFEVLTRFHPAFFIDDRRQVVEMYRSRGFTVLQCAPGDF